MTEYNYVAVTGANNVGKSTIASIVIWTFQKTRPFAVGQATSVDSIQLSVVLWAELRRWYDRSLELQRAFEFHDRSFFHRQHRKTWWMIARTARKQRDINLKDGGEHVTGLQGIHAPHVLMVIDEASGVEDPNWEAAESSIREPDNKLFAISNPLRVSGRMFQVFHIDTFRKYWYTRSVSYLECARIDKEMADEQIQMLGGPTNPVVQIRFFGRFPERGADDTRPTYDQVQRAMARARDNDIKAINILLRLMEGGVPVDCYYNADTLKDYLQKFSFNRETDFLPEYLYKAKLVGVRNPPKVWLDLVAHYFSGPCRLGVDLAGYGTSETVFAVRRGWRIVELRPRHHIGQPEILANIRELYKFYDNMDMVLVDKTGLYGEGVCDSLKEDSIPSVAVGFGESSMVAEEFANQATEMWFEFAENIDQMELPYDLQLLSQMTTRPYKFTGKKLQKVVMSKDQMKARKVPSPDRADAVGLAVKRIQIVTDDQMDDTLEQELWEPEDEGTFIGE